MANAVTRFIAIEEEEKGSILEKLRNGTAQFELLPASPLPFFASSSSKPHLFFARTAPPPSPAINKAEHFKVRKVTGDGRCMFRALVKGMALNKGIALDPREERDEADELRMAVKEVLCNGEEERRQHEHALLAITLDESLRRYCQRIGRSDFWGGEPELLVLSKLYSQPITVYIPAHEHSRGGWGSGFIPIQEYGAEFCSGSGNKKPRKVVRLLYSGKNHYDLLV